MICPQPIPPISSSLEDGYEAWLRYRPHKETSVSPAICDVFGAPEGPIRDELALALPRLAGRECKFQQLQEYEGKGLVFRLERNPEIGPEGYEIVGSMGAVEVRACADIGLLYGTFALLRKLSLGVPVQARSVPYHSLRMLNHWDDPVFDSTLGPFNVTRGMAGNSIFNWGDLPRENPRIRDYARLLASIGINAICINNVNANPDVLETRSLPGLIAVAEAFRPYGIKTFVAVCFTAPMITDGVIGNENYGPEYHYCMRQRRVRLHTMVTADPLNPDVQAWWRAKADELYRAIPDFGGFVIKANSEGMPGPQDYGRTHADGANCIARGLAPHGGVLFYRTFIYNGIDESAGPQSPRSDGACQPFLEFRPLDGDFDANVILQTKCGPADFRSDEPPSPLFGAMPQTRQAIEFMIAQEYLGYTTHVVFQATDWTKILNFDTHQSGEGTTVAAVTAGKRRPYREGAIVGVANVGDDPNWFGHGLAAANLYAYGCLAWEGGRDPNEIAREWSRLTFSPSESVVETVAEMLADSYRLYARYTIPLGLNTMYERSHHFDPNPDNVPLFALTREGIGTNRSVANGTQYVGQYEINAGAQWEFPHTTPVEQLLFFHYLPWDHVMPTGEALCDYLVRDRREAVEEIHAWLERWESLRGELDWLRWAQIFERLYRQYMHAAKWRDAGLEALRSVGKWPQAKGSTRPLRSMRGDFVQEFSQPAP